MQINKSYKILVIFFFIIGCSRSQSTIDSNEDVSKFKSFFKSEALSLLSSTYNKDLVFLEVVNPSALMVEGYSMLLLEQKPKDFNLVVSDLKNDNIFNSNIKDTFQFTIPHFKNAIPETKFPIPNLDNPIFRNRIDSSKVDIFGLKQGAGCFFNKRGLEEAAFFTQILSIKPLGRGFSNGAIVDYSSRTIIFWIIVW
jgi:hypothetical protein